MTFYLRKMMYTCKCAFKKYVESKKIVLCWSLEGIQIHWSEAWIRGSGSADPDPQQNVIGSTGQ
jgi:hypothetical protein